MQKDSLDVHAALYVGNFAGSGMGPMVSIRVAERKGMETGKILVPTASEMNQAMMREGRIALYGIFFDTGQAAVKPESKATLDQIGGVMRANPKLAVLVVGHTDHVGDYQANLTLSQRRASAVVEHLTKQYGVAGARL